MWDWCDMNNLSTVYKNINEGHVAMYTEWLIKRKEPRRRVIIHRSPPALVGNQSLRVVAEAGWLWVSCGMDHTAHHPDLAPDRWAAAGEVVCTVGKAVAVLSSAWLPGASVVSGCLSPVELPLCSTHTASQSPQNLSWAVSWSWCPDQLDLHENIGATGRRGQGLSGTCQIINAPWLIWHHMHHQYTHLYFCVLLTAKGSVNVLL